MKFCNALATGFAILAFSAFAPTSADARDFRYHKRVTLKVGQSIVLKGVRKGNCSQQQAPSWAAVRGGLPASRTGAFSDGGAGTVQSSYCKKRFNLDRVAARGVRFTARNRGTERLTIFKDPVSITVR